MELISYGSSQKLPPLKKSVETTTVKKLLILVLLLSSPPDDQKQRLNSDLKYTLNDNQIAHSLPPRNTLKVSATEHTDKILLILKKGIH